MSPSLRLCNAWFLAITFAAVVANASAAARSASASAVGQTFTRRLSQCSNGCSSVLGTATNFGVLGASTVTSSGATVIQGDVGTYPGTAIVGFPPGVATGNIRPADSTATLAQTDAHTGYAYLQGLTYTTALSGVDLVGLTLTPGIYFFSGGAELSGSVTLDALGDSSAQFIFQTTTTWVQSAASAVNLVNNAQPCNVYYQIGSSATIGAYSVVQGNMVAYTMIAVGHAVTSTGSLIALGAAVTLDTNEVASLGQC